MYKGCYNCSGASMHPDGRLRCGDELAVEPCSEHSFGSPKVYTMEELVKLRKNEIGIAEKKAQKTKVIKPVSIKRKDVKPTQQRRLL